MLILDNASAHRNEIIKDLVNKDNKLLYSIPYQHFTNAIEHYFSILKSKLQKLEGLTYKELSSFMLRKVIKDIPKETYKNLLIGSYKRDVVYVKKHQENQEIKNGVLNLQRCITKFSLKMSLIVLIYIYYIDFIK